MGFKLDVGMDFENGATIIEAALLLYNRPFHFEERSNTNT